MKGNIFYAFYEATEATSKGQSNYYSHKKGNSI